MPAAAIRYLDPSKLRFFKHEGGTHLRVELLDEFCIIEARVRRAFPFSSGKKYLSVQDAKGNEVGILEEPEKLDSGSLALIGEELDRRYFTPMISGIQSLKNDGGMWTFVVTTQRGVSEFYVRNWRDSSHEIAPGRYQIYSVDGQRFEIPNYEGLDNKSKTLMDQLF
ncbi:MAG TPA: DUF1854 domain-containing protein [Fimbriimonadaceae bacterium]|jgi:hypothetical protein